MVHQGPGRRRQKPDRRGVVQAVRHQYERRQHRQNIRKPLCPADLEHILLCVDDDMRIEALRQTNYVKSIVTAQGQMDLGTQG